jgi:hypothetical protein
MRRTERLRVLVSLHDAHPELVEDLVVLDRRLRAERMRMLATIGLAVLRIRAPAPVTQPAAEALPERPQTPTDVPDDLAARKARLLDRIG